MQAPLQIPSEKIKALRARLKEGRGALRLDVDRLGVGAGIELCENTTDLVDEIVTEVAAAAIEALREGLSAAAASLVSRVALVAFGSFGRRELCPYSDVDLMFLKPPGLSPEQLSTVEEYVRIVLYGLWDLGFEVGHAVRDVPEALAAAEEQSVLSGLLDARLLDGPDTPAREHVFQELRQAVRRVLFSGSRAERLIEEKIEEAARRRERFGSSVFLLEPNLKDGEGGLRELHTALWIAQAAWRAGSVGELRRLGKISGRESQALSRAYGFLLGVRVELHLAAKRKQDVLRFQHQEAVAEQLGYIPAGEQNLDRRTAGTERFMRAYYFNAQSLKHNAELIVERAMFNRRGKTKRLRGERAGFRVWNGTLTVKDGDQFRRDPVALLRIVRVSAEEGLDIYSYTKTLISSAREHLGHDARRSPAAVQEFLRILSFSGAGPNPVEALHSFGLLQQMIPEFSRVTARWQHSLYHVYTVDVHSLVVLSNLHRMMRGELEDRHEGLKRRLDGISRPWVLYMAALLHDVGKGWPKERHSDRGAKVAAVVGARLEAAAVSSWTHVDTEDLVWLVQEHLTMSDISQRRDLSDPELIERFTDKVCESERLCMLYLLTIADMMGTSPTVWTEWKGSLLDELLTRTRGVLEERGGGIPARTLIQERRERVFDEIISASKGCLQADEVAAFLATMDSRYLLKNPPVRMVRHIKMWKRSSETGELQVAMRHMRREGLTRITVVCVDRPGLLALISGTLAGTGLQIQAAAVNSAGRYRMPNERIALDVVWVSHELAGAPSAPDIWRRLRENLRRVLTDGEPVEALMEDRLSGRLAGAPEPSVRVRVDYSNTVNSKETVFDVFGRDRIGALYDMCRVFQDAGLSISLAKISTQGSRFADGFYVTDAETGEKLSDPERLKALRAQLLAVSQNPSQPAA